MRLILDKIRNNHYIQKYPSLKQFIKFSIVGASITVFDFGIYTSLTRLIEFLGYYYLIANLISFSCAVTASFFLNKYWTFRNKERGIHLQYGKFLVVASIGLAGNELILFSLVHFFGVYDLLAKAIATAVIWFWNFFANKHWTFKDKNKII